MIIAIDFDGTCVTNEYPKIGEDIGAQKVLKKLLRKGHKLVLNTIRDKYYRKDAIDWFRMNGIELSSPVSFSISTKLYAELYIDDLALGIPLKNDFMLSESPFVDWLEVEVMLLERGIL